MVSYKDRPLMIEEGNTGKHFKDTLLEGKVYLNCLVRVRFSKKK